MRSIQKRFSKISEENPNLSSFICFGRAVEGQRFTKYMIKHWFRILVEKEDYGPADKGTLLKHFYALSNNEEM